MLKLNLHRAILYPQLLEASRPPSASSLASALLLRRTSSPQRSAPTLLPPPLSRSLLQPLSTRSFHSSPPRRDIIFFSFPALKSGLLTITRVSLLMLPFVWRWKLWRTYRTVSLALLQIPIFALCLVFALGLDQSPTTHRWRLLLMGEAEELAWSRRRAEAELSHSLPLLLGSTSPQSVQVLRVTTRLVEAIEDFIHPKESIVSFAELLSRGAARDPHDDAVVGAFAGNNDWGPGAWGEAMWLKERSTNLAVKEAKAKAALRSSPEEQPRKAQGEGGLKNVVKFRDWKVYVVNLPKINAFALPSKELFVYSGLIDLVQEDELLAAVLAHEMAHVTQRHAVENLGFLNVATVLFDVVRGISYALTISFPLLTDGFALGINYLNDVVAHRAYSRKLEMEADEVGIQFMSLAGYNPLAAADLWTLMAAVEADAAAAGQPIGLTEKFELLRSHPSSGQRQRRIEELLPEALEVWKGVVRRKKGKGVMEVETVEKGEEEGTKNVVGGV